MASGTVKDFIESDTTTAKYLKGLESIPVPSVRRKHNDEFIVLKGAKGNNLKNVTIKIPVGNLVCISGVSGSGKSTLINETLYPLAHSKVYGSQYRPLAYDSIS